MTLIQVIDAYVTLQRSLGMRFEAAARLLRQFDREMGGPRIGQVPPEAVANFLQGTGSLSATWTLKYSVLSGLYRFAISRGHVDGSPLPANRPKLPPPQSPYVYSTDELRRLLDATACLYVAHSQLQAPMYRTLLLLLYGSGIRIWRPISSCGGSFPCRRATIHSYSRRAPVGDGPINMSSRCFSVCVRQPASIALPANSARRAYTISDTPRPCIACWLGIARGRMFSGYCRNWQLISAMPISNPP